MEYILAILALLTPPTMFLLCGPTAYIDVSTPTIKDIREQSPNATEEEIGWIIEYEENYWGEKLKEE